MKINKCKTCIHFKNGQRELNYWPSTGFCVNPKFKFNTIDGRLIGVYDKCNEIDRSKVTGNPSHDIETVQNFKPNESRYLLQVEANFGCIYHSKK